MGRGRDARDTPVSQTLANPPHTNPHAKRFAWGAPHAKNNVWGCPHTFLTQNLSFSSSPQKNWYLLTAIFMPPHASPHIPIHPHAPFLHRNLHRKFAFPKQKFIMQSSPHKLQSLVLIPTQNFVPMWVCETGVSRGSHENLIGNLQCLVCLETSILVPYFEYISVQSRPKLAGQ